MLADKVSKLKFLVDTGADVSVLPKHYAPKADSSNELLLLAANGTKIATFGKKRLTLDLNLRRNFTWSFIIANVNQPIIGLGFLKHYNLLVDVKSGCLIDGITILTTQGKYTNTDSLTSAPISGSKNVVADTLSRINEVHIPKIDFSALAEAQASDEELQAILGKNELSFFLKPLSTDPDSSKLYCDVQQNKIRPYIPEIFRKKVFLALHNISHPTSKCACH
ncbi:retrovirus-related Pol polyprotein from transposon opus [Trichonephila clavata]|uniref:Retrovirus-related Pol polyprotein from transposon opus n=1 Tax=Trichonephila clavata TaxID=2740835 RepID=A0A8X6I490_TRICU|nr:retrovirus-related Pol polyprotein from transposon opus [Trichonephila clavata]